MTIRTWVFFAAAALCLAAAPALGPEWQPSPITSCRSGYSSEPHLSENGRRVIFLSSCNLLSDNSDRSIEIFDWEAGKTAQLTRGSYCQVFTLAPAPDGESIAFLSNCPYRGKNQDQGIELMMRDRKGEVTVLTRSHGQEIKELAWSADGHYLYFSSTANFTQENDDTSQEIFSLDFDATPPAFRQVSHTTRPRGCSYPVPVPGAVLALCDEDFLQTAPPEAVRGLPTLVAGRKPGGGNPDYNQELMSFSLGGEVRQLTRTAGCKNQPAVAASSGRVIALVSDCNLADPKKPGTGPTLYLYSREKFTPAIPGLVFEPRNLAMSRDGSTLVFTASLFTERQNPGHNQQVFMLRLNELKLARPLARGAFPAGLHLVSNFPTGSVRSPSVSADGRAVAFAANSNFARTNPDGNFEIVLARPLPASRTPEPDDSDEPDERAGDTVEAAPAEPEESAGETASAPEPKDEPLLPPGLRP